MNNSLTANRKAPLSVYLTQDAVKNQINRVVGGKNGDRFVSSLVSAVTANPTLQECTNQSLLSAALLGQSLNLSPSPQLGQFYMVPFDNRKMGCKVAQFQIGYKGYIQLAVRSGYYKRLNVLPVKEGELVSYDPLEEVIKLNLIEDEEERENARTIGYYASFEYLNGFRKAIYWSRAKMQAHAERYSKGYSAHKGYTFWEKDFDSMACKTMLRQLISKWGIMSIDMQTALESDMAEIRPDGTPEYVDTEAMPQDALPAEAPRVATAEQKVPAAASKEAPAPQDIPEAPEPDDPFAALFGGHG